MKSFVCLLLLMVFQQFCTAGLAYAQAAPNNQQQVNNIRIWHSPDNTRAVFDVSANVSYKLFTLNDPLRVVIDIQNVNLSMTLPSLDAGNRHISEIRSGRPSDNVLRIVFGLKQPLKVTDFVLSPNELYGHRLVLDFEETVAPKKTSKAGVKTVVKKTDKPNVLANEASVQTSPKVNQGQKTKAVAAKTVLAPQRAKLKPLIVAIDAGHGGEDPGATGHRGSREKKITLQIANRLKKIVDADPKMKSYMVRQGDYYINLHKRRQMARANNADLFISIHADAFKHRSAKGFSVFALSQRGATSAMARALAAKENASDLIGGVSLADKDDVLAKVLVDLSMTNTVTESVSFGGLVLKQMSRIGKLHSAKVEQAGFAVLKSADVPSVLVEVGFITNPDEERSLKSSHYQQKIANGLYAAIQHYFKHKHYRRSTPVVVQSSQSANDTGVYVSKVTPANRSRSNNSAKPRYHKVVRGNSLSQIAAKYGTSTSQLKKVNRIRGNTIQLGQRLKIPASAKRYNLASANVTNTKQTAAELVYTVRRGDSLSRIAQRYGISINTLKKTNNLRKNSVMIGQKLKVPAAKGLTKSPTKKSNASVKKTVRYKVKRGDTLSGIAQRYGTSMRKIMTSNRLKSKNIMRGQVLTIPN